MSDSPYELDVDALAKANPHIDGGQLQEAQAEQQKLREQGQPRPGYGIQSPHERRPLTREPGLHIRRP